MHEKLVADWLDSASERTYQSTFCQILAAKGYRVVHSTRHSPIELGKDVLAVAPDGIPCAFQLKGNPGGRLTSTGLRDILPQLSELTDLSIDYPGMPKGPHRSYLVTNGSLQEEAALSVTRFNQQRKDVNPACNDLEVIQRSDLLADLKKHGHQIWPDELEDVQVLLELLLADGTGPLPHEKLDKLLTRVLLLVEAAPTVGSAELRRRVASAALLTSLAIQRFAESQNHYAVSCAWTQFAVAAIGATARHAASYPREVDSSISLAEDAALDALVALATEVINRPNYIEGDPVVDSIAYRARRTLLQGALALTWHWCELKGWPDTLARQRIYEFLSDHTERVLVWGEGCFPQVLMRYWFLHEYGNPTQAENLLAECILNTCTSRGEDTQPGLAQPYWTFEDVARHDLGPVLGGHQDPMKYEARGTMSYFIEGPLHLVVRSNRKVLAKVLWPQATLVDWIHFIPEPQWAYCTWRSSKGEYHQLTPQLTKQWPGLLEDACNLDCPHVPGALLNRPLLLAAYIMMYPWRATPHVIRWLGHCLESTWYMPRKA